MANEARAGAARLVKVTELHANMQIIPGKIVE